MQSPLTIAFTSTSVPLRSTPAHFVMAQTLDDFLKEAREEIARFEKTWREEHEKDPETYPLEMRDGNEGLWWEFLRINAETAFDDNVD